jgi:hypothetical protein
MGEARVRVALVDRPGEADWWVYRVGSWGEASGDSYWYITRDKQDATAWVYFCSLGLAQVSVCFVSNRGEAGWRREHPLRGRFR